jgi:hypothetical protein
MANKTVYISCPISVSESILDRFAKTVETTPKVSARYWTRGTRYDQKFFDTSNAYLFILPHNKFECENGELPIGLKRELVEAYESGKKIYVGYIAKDGGYNIYSAHTNGRSIRGIAGTTHDLYDWATSNEKFDPVSFEPIIMGEKTFDSNKKGNTDYSFDERALLMLS